jgi:hypothetical protein
VVDHLHAVAGVAPGFGQQVDDARELLAGRPGPQRLRQADHPVHRRAGECAVGRQRSAALRLPVASAQALHFGDAGREFVHRPARVTEIGRLELDGSRRKGLAGRRVLGHGAGAGRHVGVAAL